VSVSRTFVIILLGLAASVASGQYLEATIPVGDSPAEVLWADAVNKVYVANSQDASVTVIDGATNAVLTTIPVGDYPDFLCWNRRENKVYCTRGETEDRLVVIDAIGDTVLREVPISHCPGHMALSETQNKLYISCNDDPVYRITVLDCGPDTVLRNIPAQGVGALLWSPATNRVFSCGADTIRVIDCESDEVVVRMQGGGDVWCYNPVNELIYLAARHSIYALSPGGDSIVAEVPGWAYALAAVPFTNKVYASGSASGIQVIDAANNIVADTIPVVTGDMVCDLAKGRVYGANFNTHEICVVGAWADSLIKTIPLGRYPEFLCWNSVDSRVYVNDFMDNVVYVIRDTSTGISETERGLSAHRSRPATVWSTGALWHAGCSPADLVDACGRRVCSLRPGHNDIRALAPGVYFVRQGDDGRACKVVTSR